MPKRSRERRRRGDGAIYPVRKDGKIVRYAAAVQLGTVDGKRKRKVIYGATEADVAAELTKLRADHLRGLDIAPSRMTLTQYLGAWLKSVELSKSAGTLRIYRRAVFHILRYLGTHTLGGLKAEHVEYLMTELRDAGLAAGTRKTIRAVLVNALNQALERDYVTKNVAALVDAPSVRKGKVKAFTEAQLARLLAAARGHWIEPLIQVGVRLGLRSGETRALLWADLDYAALTIRISGAIKHIDGRLVREVTKTEDSDSLMPLPPGLVAIFRARWDTQQQQRKQADHWEEQGLIFTDQHGRPIDGTTLAHAFTRLAGGAGLPSHLTYHSLRHTCAALLIARKAQPRQVMEVLRHRSIVTTMNTYGHLFPEVTRETINELNRDLDRLAAGGNA